MVHLHEIGEVPNGHIRQIHIEDFFLKELILGFSFSVGDIRYIKGPFWDWGGQRVQYVADKLKEPVLIQTIIITQ